MDRKKFMMMEARGIICSKCRQRLSIVSPNSTEVKCPICNFLNPIPTYERSNCKGLARVCDRFRNKEPETLNKKPSPLNVSESSSESKVRPSRKRALLIGVTYKWKHKLKGTINDVKSVKELLTNNFGFKEENMLVLTEQENEELIPTKKNILRSLEWLVKGCKSGDSLVFFYSGHGLRQPDFEGDEIDGYDETICPVDFLKEGMILDNDINSTIVWPIKEGVILHAIIDACHSGTVLDLEHVYNRQDKKWEDNKPPSGKLRKHTDGGLAICISACLDNQVAADTSAFTKTMNGAMTYLLVKCLKEHQGVTYGDLLDLMDEGLQEFNESGCPPAKFVRKIFNNIFTQTAQLSASKPFDVYHKHFLL